MKNDTFLNTFRILDKELLSRVEYFPHSYVGNSAENGELANKKQDASRF